MTTTIQNLIKKIKAKLGFHGVSDSDVLKAGNTAYDGLLNNTAFPNPSVPLPVFRQFAGAGRRRRTQPRSRHRRRARRVRRVAGIRGQHYVARVDQGQGNMADAVLGAERWQDLGGRIQVHVESFAVPAGDRLAELGEPEVGRIPVVGRVRGRLLQHADYARRRREVWIADAE